MAPMKNLPRIITALIPGLLLLTFGGVAPADEAPLGVTVSILPQVWFAERIGGEQTRAEALVGPGHSPATFEPTSRQMANLEQATVFFCAGVPFENGLLRRVAGLKNAPPIHGPRPEAGHDHHDHHGHHHHEDGMDPHTWLDPMQAAAMGDTMATVLAQLDPAHAALYLERAATLRRDLARLSREIETILQPVRGRTFFVYHPAYGHFARAFGLKQVAIETGGREPGPRQLAQVIDQIRQQGAEVIVVQPQFSRKSAQSISRATGATLLPLDPLAPEYDTNLRHIATELARALQGAAQ